jgi:hypothetical protein
MRLIDAVKISSTMVASTALPVDPSMRFYWRLESLIVPKDRGESAGQSQELRPHRWNTVAKLNINRPPVNT